MYGAKAPLIAASTKRWAFIAIIYRRVIGDNLLPIIIIAQNSFDLSITNIVFIIYFVIADKLSR